MCWSPKRGLGFNSVGYAQRTLHCLPLGKIGNWLFGHFIDLRFNWD